MSGLIWKGKAELNKSNFHENRHNLLFANPNIEQVS